MPARELPARPNLDQYKKQAKDLLKLCRAGDPEALRRMNAMLRHSDETNLADAQFVLAREHGFADWPAFAKQIQTLSAERTPLAAWRRAEKAVMAGDADALERVMRDHEDAFRGRRPQSSTVGGFRPEYEAGDARSIVASSHHFESWERFVAFNELKGRNPSIKRFEAAADAIVAGDLSPLTRLLRSDSELVRARSIRNHHSTLLHYVGANGVEGFRQRTPNNVVEVAEVLLRAGAEIDAVADMYGGSTTLGLVATSVHPKRAGVQESLMEVLLAHGARIDPPAAAGSALLVSACLANGRGEAAEFLARRGAPLDLEAAAGVGRLDIVESFFDRDGRLKPSTMPVERTEALKRACAYGRTNVVEFLLDRGEEVDRRFTGGLWAGTTALHLAAFGGHVQTVQALLKRRAPVDVKDDTYGTTPLTWALYAWANEPDTAPPSCYHEIVRLLVMAGSRVNPEWLEADWARADPRMLAALSGKQD